MKINIDFQTLQSSFLQDADEMNMQGFLLSSNSQSFFVVSHDERHYEDEKNTRLLCISMAITGKNTN